MTADRLAVTRRIEAPAARVFALVVDPAAHVRIDGSGMLEAAADARPVTAAGDTFDMDMDRTPLNDIPGLVKYKVRNTVTRFEPDRLVEWNVGGVGQPPVGHVYGWVIEPTGDDACDVTNFCDWSHISDEMRSSRPWPVVPVEMLERSLANLQRIATEA